MPSNLPDLTPSMSEDMRKRIVRRLAEIARTDPRSLTAPEVAILAQAVQAKTVT